MLFVDGGANRVGIGTGSPDTLLHLSGAGAQQINLETTDGATTIIAIALKNSANTWQIENGRASNVLSVRSSTGGETIRAHANGVTAFNSGIALGVGLNNTAANVLDDYEIGTWTPGVANMTVTGTLTTGGTYTKIGDLVHLTFFIKAATSIAHGASAIINNFPFAGYGSAAAFSAGAGSAFAGNANNQLASANYHPFVVVTQYDSRCWVSNFITTGANHVLHFTVVYRTN